MVGNPGQPEGAADAEPVEEEETGGLLTPQERELRRDVRALRKKSDRLVRDSAQATRPREFIQSFPPPAGADAKND